MVFTIYGHGGHLGHVTSIMLIDFHFHVPKSLPWAKVKNDLDLEYSHTFINSITCLPLPNFRTQAAILSEKSTFSYEKAYFTKFDLAVKKIKVNPGSSFEQTMVGRSPRCYIPSFVEIGPQVLEKIFEGFLSYMGM